eukprot:m.485621 g.485621  ORF g.485621 m.485621 type:complete len:640 (+) comp23891_c0_seq1:123-2042(+)
MAFVRLLPFWACLVVVAAGAAAGQGAARVSIEWDDVLRISQTSTTLQVVSNPILDRTFNVNGKVFPNPIHTNAWASLGALEADFVRYVPWFPYPHVSVAELDPPLSNKSTSWNFEYIAPMFDDFMNQTHLRNHTTVINFSTQPCWLYNAKDCSYPANPDQSDFGYVRGNALKDPTATDLAAYYGRLLSYMMKGNFTDENGVVHVNPKPYPNMTYWEVFNEAEHGYTPEWYTHDYDVVVSKIREVADMDHRLRFVGIGGASPSWIPYFLNRSNHAVKDIPLDYVSIHFYAGCSNRTDPNTYVDFFHRADGFIQSMVNDIIPSRDAVLPSTKLDLDELGVIMPDDNNPNLPIDANLPDTYWHAAGAMYAYLFAKLSLHGVDVMGHSQLAGSPGIPEWNIPLPQYPSVSLLDWRTGYGNARYWVLKLLIEHFAPGDKIVNTTVPVPPVAPSNPFCGWVVGPDYGSVTLSCPSGVIDSIEFADWGMPTGSCGSFGVDASCTTEAKTKPWATAQCVGKSTCSLQPYPALGDPCVNKVKWLAVQANCSSGSGYANNSTQASPDVDAQAFVHTNAITGAQERKVLLINRTPAAREVTVPGAKGGMLFAVDEFTTPRGTPNGIRSAKVYDDSFYVHAYATVVVVLPN